MPERAPVGVGRVGRPPTRGAAATPRPAGARLRVRAPLVLLAGLLLSGVTPWVLPPGGSTGVAAAAADPIPAAATPAGRTHAVTAAATVSPVASLGWAGGRGSWPVRPVVLLAGFRPPAVRWGAGHRGLDLAATAGQPVRAAAAGVVTFAAVLAGRGVVVVSHGALRTTYEPVRADVDVGARVTAGERIGVLTTGAGHCGGTPACLHWGLRRGSAYLDPRLLLLPVRPVLLPPGGR